ncbi:acyl carrier protein [Actinoplanes sp. NPDC049681]|uniref:acyl carrier protein n=1 Tax=Actinoplanes sp. NPDC049681 TaxID=3363905 RepID=UPI0037A34147
MTTPVFSDTDLAAAIRREWSTALRQEGVTDDENFFAAGGNSLLAIAMVGRLSAVLGVRLPLRLVFDHQSVAELTPAVRQLVPSDGGTPR